MNSYQKAIALANKCVSDVSVQTSLLKYITPISNQTNTYCVSIGSGLYDSNPSNNDGDGSDGSANQCKKEPVILSGTFRTYDRPGINQQFEDDGFGNLRMFYNTGIKKVYTNNAAELLTIILVVFALVLLILSVQVVIFQTILSSLSLIL